MRELRKTPAYREKERLYRQSESRKRSIRKYEESDKAKIVRKKRIESGKKALSDLKYRNSIGGQTIRTNWDKSEHGKQLRKKYRQSAKGKLAIERARLRVPLINILGGKCVMCGFDNIIALELDHINGDGKLDRKTFGRYGTLRYYYNNQDKLKENIQVLCANCHRIKHRS